MKQILLIFIIIFTMQDALAQVKLSKVL